jgi:hypothetical protein
MEQPPQLLKGHIVPAPAAAAAAAQETQAIDGCCYAPAAAAAQAAAGQQGLHMLLLLLLLLGVPQVQLQQQLRQAGNRCQGLLAAATACCS